MNIGHRVVNVSITDSCKSRCGIQCSALKAGVPCKDWRVRVKLGTSSRLLVSAHCLVSNREGLGTSL